jgi:hypothetical protein
MVSRRIAIVLAVLVAVTALACTGNDHPQNIALVTSTTRHRRTTTTRHRRTTTTVRPTTTTTTVRPTTTTARPTTTTTQPSTGPCPVFPADNPWNTDITNAALHPNSANYVASIGASTHLHPDFGTFWDGGPIGIPFVHVGAGQPKVPVSFYYASQSDPGPYPIPPDAPVEGGANSTGDRHVLVVDDAACRLYEMFDSHKQTDNSWKAGSGAVFDLRSNALRSDYWTSADAAGLPIYAGLVRYDEVQAGAINHALRFTVAKTQKAFIHPATHYASDATDANLPPMGLRFRMKASYSCASLSHEAQVVCAALKRYGMFVADNGSNWYISGEHNPSWNDDALGDIKTIPGSAFEALNTGPIVH